MILFFRFTHRFFFFGIFARYTNAIIWRYFFYFVCVREFIFISQFSCMDFFIAVGTLHIIVGLH